MPTGIGSGIAGEVFTDEIGSGSRGGSTICPTRYSVNLNGSSQFGLETGTLLDLGTDNFSYSFWFKTSEASVQGITSTDLSNAGTGLDIFLSATGILTATFDSVTFPTTASLNDGEWYHAVLSVDRSGDWKWYIDGINTNTLANPVGTAIFVGTYMWGVGDISSPSFNGNLTELSIWGTALSSSEVLTIYNNMFGSQTCLTDLTFGSGNLIQNGSFNEIGPQLIDNPTFNAPTSPDLIVNGDFSAAGSNLVDNPNFTDTGSELIVDGGFPNGSTAWNETSGGTIVDNEMQIDCGTTPSAYTYQSKATAYTSGKSYKLTVKIVSNTTGTDLILYAGGSTPNATNISIGTTPDTYTIYFVADYTSGTGKTIIPRALSSTGIVVIDNVSVKELGADWTLGTGWSIDSLGATSAGSNEDAYVSQGGLTVGKSYKVTFDITAYTSGSLSVRVVNDASALMVNAVGSYEAYVVPIASTAIGFRSAGGAGGFVGSFSNISVKELGEGWTTTTGVSITDKATMSVNSDYQILTSTTNLTAGKSYKLTLSANRTIGTGLLVFSASNGAGITVLPALDSDSDNHSFFFTPADDVSGFSLKRGTGSGVYTWEIDNVFIQEVDWNFGGGWSLGSNKALATAAVGGDTLSQTGVFTLDKSYKTTFLSTMEVGDNCFAEFGSDGFIGQLPTGTASNLFYYQTNEVGDSARIAFEVQSIMTGSISNVLTYQMDPNGYWNIPTANSTQLVLNPTFTNTGPEEVTNGDFSQTVLGSELVTNGDFATDLIPWTGVSGRGSYTWDNGKAKITNDGASSYPNLYQGITTEAGKTYKITATVEIGTANNTELRAYSGGVLGSQQLNVDGTMEFTFTAVDASTTIICYLWETGNTGNYCYFDNVSVKEVLQEVTNGDFTEGVEQLTQPIDLTVDFIGINGGVIDDANSFTTDGTPTTEGIRNNVGTFDLVDGKSYKLVIAGTTTSSGFTIGSVTASGNEYGTGFGTHYFVATTANPTTLWIRQQTAGTTDLTTFTIEELGADWIVTNAGAGNIVQFNENGAYLKRTVSSATEITQSVYDITKNYKVVIDFSYVSGGVSIEANGDLSRTSLSEGVNTFYIAPSSVDIKIICTHNTAEGTVNSVSVQELGDGWTLGTGVTIGEDKAVLLNPPAFQYQLIQTVGVTPGNSYKVIYEITDRLSGTIRVRLGSNLGATRSSNEVFEEVIVAQSTLLIFQTTSADFNGSITDISVKELGLDWVSPDAGVVNTFSATGLTMTSVNGAGDNTIRQDNVTADDQAYKVDYNIVGSSLTAGNYLQFYNGATYVNMKTTVGSHILHFTRSGADDSVYLRLASNDGSTTDTVDIGSITIVEVQGWTLEDGKLVGDLPDLAKSATQDIGAIAGNSYKATMDVAIAEEELITNGSFREVGADLVLDGDFPLPNVNWLIAASTTINGGSATFGGLGTVADLLAAAFVVRVEADGGVAEAQSCLISDLTFLTENP
jgi:hypothetical protein